MDILAGKGADRLKLNQLLAGAFKPSSHIAVSYPVFDLVNDAAGEKFAIIPAPDAEQRHEPFPIVPTRLFPEKPLGHDLQINAFDSVMTITKRGMPQEIPGDLIGDIDYLTQFETRTSLDCVAFLTPSVISRLENNPEAMPGFHEVRLRIKRTTRLTGLLKSTQEDDWESDDEDEAESDDETECEVTDGDEYTSESIYEMSLAEFTEVLEEHNDFDRLWLVDLGDLVHQSTHRAACHVKASLALADVEYMLEGSWKKARRDGPPNEATISLMTTVLDREGLKAHNATLSPDDKITSCPVCTENYEDSDNENLKVCIFPCFQGHCICLECVESMCKQYRVQKVTCPSCHQILCTEDVERQLEPNYLDSDLSKYDWDDDYDAYENFERSCADLDSQPLPKELAVDANRLEEFWQHLVFTVHEPYNSRLHHNYRFYEEYGFATRAFKKVFCRFHGTITDPIILRDECFAQFYADIHSHYDKKKQYDVSYFVDRVRPDFFFWLLKNIDRVLKFQGLRECKPLTAEQEANGEVHECAEKTKVHCHGFRAYWNDFGVDEDDEEEDEEEIEVAQVDEVQAEDEQPPSPKSPLPVERPAGWFQVVIGGVRRFL